MIRALLSPRLWLALALAGLLAFTHHKAFTGGKAAVQAVWTAEKLAISEAGRQREKALTIANQGVDRAYQADKNRRAAAERRTADSLRDFKAAVAKPDDTSTPSGDDDPYRAIAGECAGAIEKLDRYAQSVASKATALQDYTREVCMSQ
jgi:hypothetical protein